MPRVLALLDQVEGLAARASLVVDRVEVVVGAATAEVARVGAVVDAAKVRVESVGAVVDAAAAQVDRVGGVVDGAAVQAGRAAVLIDLLEPSLTTLQPTLQTLADTTHPEEVAALVTLIDHLPAVTLQVERDVLPVVGDPRLCCSRPARASSTSRVSSTRSSARSPGSDA